MSTKPDRNPTMLDVAQAAGVSTMTVSYFYSRPDRVSPRTQQAVRAAAERLGYTGPNPTALALRRRRNGALGVVFGEHLTYAFEDPQACRFLAGIADVCRTEDVTLSLIPSTGDGDDARRVRAAACDGYIVWTTVAGDEALATAVATGKPVAIQGGPRIKGARMVSINDRASAVAVARTSFVNARRPAVVSFPFDRDRRARLEYDPDASEIEFPVTRERLLGIYDACRELGIAQLPVAVVARNDASSPRGLVADLFDEAEPDAVVAMSDQLAFAVLDEAQRRGLHVPQQLAVAGWDDGPEAHERGLTTIAQSLFEQGRQCARIALSLRQSSVAADWTLMTRHSTAGTES